MNTDWPSWLAVWVATYALHSSLLLVAAWVLTRLPALRVPRASEVVWRTALFGGVLTACLHVILGAPLWRALIVEDAGRTPAPFMHEIPERAMPTSPVFERPTDPTPSVAPASADAAPRPRPVSPMWLLLLWPIGALVLLWRGHRMKRRFACALEDRRDVEDADLLARVARAANAAGVGTAVRLTEATSLASPVAFGTFNQEICLPARATTILAPRHMDAMLAHEMAHLARRDPLWLGGYRVITALFFFQPLNHLAVARLRDTSEMLCDAWAARTKPQRVALAECLTIVARWIVVGAPPEGAPAMARKTSRLADRVHALLEPHAQQATLGRARLGLLALAPVVLVMALAPGLQAVAAIPRPTLDVRAEAADPVLALDADLALLASEIEELKTLLLATGRPELARRIATRVTSLEARRDVLLQALATKER